MFVKKIITCFSLIALFSSTALAQTATLYKEIGLDLGLKARNNSIPVNTLEISYQNSFNTCVSWRIKGLAYSQSIGSDAAYRFNSIRYFRAFGLHTLQPFEPIAGVKASYYRTESLNFFTVQPNLGIQISTRGYTDIKWIHLNFRTIYGFDIGRVAAGFKRSEFTFQAGISIAINHFSKKKSSW